MLNSTTNVYKMKREILGLCSKFSKGLTRPQRKFNADMMYGLLASKSCLLSDIADALHENIRKKNTIERLANHLANGTSITFLINYLKTIRKWMPAEPVVHIDDTDVIKPNGHKFEALGIVRDGSAKENTLTKGYIVTEACALTKSGHPVSVFSHIHSSKEKGYVSANEITFRAIEQAKCLFGKTTFVMDRGYDDNKMFHKLDDQEYVIRLTSRRKLLLHNKWVPATELCNRRKGKVKLPLFYKGKDHDAYLSHVKVQITASRKNIYLVLVYGITDKPMMLATNKEIKSKEDIIKVAKLYFSRWRIEEYFRAKKQIFQFENFRVRSLVSINALNMLITSCMAFLAHMTMKNEAHSLKVAVIKKADPLKKKVLFQYYRLALGISRILSYAHQGVRLWFKAKRPRYRQLKIPLYA
jgi:hypothetical protein